MGCDLFHLYNEREVCIDGTLDALCIYDVADKEHINNTCSQDNIFDYRYVHDKFDELKTVVESTSGQNGAFDYEFLNQKFFEMQFILEKNISDKVTYNVNNFLEDKFKLLNAKINYIIKYYSDPNIHVCHACGCEE